MATPNHRQSNPNDSKQPERRTDLATKRAPAFEPHFLLIQRSLVLHAAGTPVLGGAHPAGLAALRDKILRPIEGIRQLPNRAAHGEDRVLVERPNQAYAGKTAQ